MLIELILKNGAVLREARLPEGSPVPRVGELVYSPADHDDAQHLHFIVTEVAYRLADDRLQPVVSCKACVADAADAAHDKRPDLLSHMGWR